MREKLGETFEGIISNVTSFGMFVELENTIEGLVRVSSMYDDYYIFDDRRYHLTGERTGKRYRIGDSVRVILVRADISTRQLEFFVADQVEKSGNGTGREKNGKHSEGKVFRKKTSRNDETDAKHASSQKSGAGKKRSKQPKEAKQLSLIQKAKQLKQPKLPEQLIKPKLNDPE